MGRWLGGCGVDGREGGWTVDWFRLLGDGWAADRADDRAGGAERAG